MEDVLQIARPENFRGISLNILIKWISSREGKFLT